MASSLQDLIPLDAPQRLAGMLRQAWPQFAARAFVAQVEPGFAALGLMDRGRRMAQALHAHLPRGFEQAARVLVASMGPPLGLDARGEPVAVPGAPGGFFYLPHSMWLSQAGLDHLDAAMAAQHALTQRFTAEFSLRPYLAHEPRAVLRRLADWAQDPSAHVRRAVSEATRPRLPWAPRLPAFIADPRPVLPLLESLRDDPSSYVRRSVANHLNDIGKDHPALLLEVAGRWLRGAPPRRQDLVRHALRTALKRGDPQALALLGHGEAARMAVAAARITPARVRVGEKVSIEVDLRNTSRQAAQALVDLRVHYAKADGSARPRVFRWKTVALPARGAERLRKTLSLRQMTTRTHHPGEHQVELMLNGRTHVLGRFTVVP